MTHDTPNPSAAAAGGLDRRSVLTATVGGMAASALGSAARAAGPGPARQRRPNIVWFRSEDNHASFIGAYGNRQARTPTIDRLAREGVRYARHFSTSPVCAPSKLAILTGMYETSLGPGHHMRANAEVPRFARGFATWLGRAGYWCTEQGLPAANPDHNTTMRRTGYDDTSGDWTKRPAGAPFFALLGSLTTHETASFFPRSGPIKAKDVKLPPYHPDDPVLRRDRAHYLNQVAKMDGEVAAVLQKLEDDGLLDDTIFIYSSDHGGVLPRSKRYCYDSGLHTPLVIWFPPRWRHLAPGPPGTVVESPTSSIDAPATVLALAGVDVPEHFAGRPLAGPRVRPRTYAFSGRNRMDEQMDFVRTVRDRRFRYVRNYMPHLSYAQHHKFMWSQPGVQRWEALYLAGRTTKTQSRFFRPKPTEELYDLDRDPHEIHNLAGRRRHRKRLRTMRKVLDAHLLETRDNGFIPEGMKAEGYRACRRPGAFPVKRVMDLAWAAARRRPKDLPRHVRALHDKNEVIRYWGALGCSMLGGHAAPATAELHQAASHDPSPWVRAQAADALTRLGDVGRGVPLLADLVASGALPKPVRLQATWSLARAGEAARSAVPALTSASLDTGDLGNAARYAIRVVNGTYVPAP